MKEHGYPHPVLKLAPRSTITKTIPEGISHLNQIVVAYQEEIVHLFLKHIGQYYYIIKSSTIQTFR